MLMYIRIQVALDKIHCNWEAIPEEEQDKLNTCFLGINSFIDQFLYDETNSMQHIMEVEAEVEVESETPPDTFSGGKSKDNSSDSRSGSRGGNPVSYSFHPSLLVSLETDLTNLKDPKSPWTAKIRQ
jgi:hypothetical protein